MTRYARGAEDAMKRNGGMVMGIYIKGLDKDLLHTILKSWDFDYQEDGRWELVVVTEPHGRLIDEDKYWEIVNQQDTDPKYSSYRDINCILLDAWNDTPTVIEAEDRA